MLNVAKAVLAAFWLLALVNLLVPFAGPYMTAIALLVLVIHVVEVAVLHARLQRCSCIPCGSGVSGRRIRAIGHADSGLKRNPRWSRI